MSVFTQSYGPFALSDGARAIELTNIQKTRVNQSIALRFTDASGNVVIPTAGTMTAYARRTGGSLFEPLDAGPIDITAIAGWPATQDPIDAIRIEPASLDSALRYYIVINSTAQDNY